MGYLLYFFILLGFCFVIPRIPFLVKSGIDPKWLVGFFLVRAGMGAINCYLSYHYFVVSDALTFHNTGLNEYHFLTTDPKYFFSETFRSYGNHYSGLLETSQSFWNNLKTNIIVKSIAVLDVFTFRNFYVNTLIYNIFIFIGSVAMFRTLQLYFRRNSTLLAFCIFLFPSALFFTSAIHRDGLIWMSIGLLLYCLHGIFQKEFTIQRGIIFLVSFLLIFCLRNYVAFTLIPAITGWWISARNPKYSMTVFSMILLLSVILFFFLRNIIPFADFPQYIANRQADFDEIASVSSTYLPMPILNANILSYVNSFPPAFEHAFLLPFIWSMRSFAEIPFALEILVTEIFFLIWIFQKKRAATPLVTAILFICLVNIIVIGYTVPNLGAILRYRSIYLQLLFCLAACSIHWKTGVKFNISKNNM